MKNTIIAIAMLFSMAIYGQDNFTGIWAQDKGSDYYTVILKNNNKGYIFTNFSFVHQNVVIENIVEETDTYIKTVVHNPENGWRVYIEYEYLDKDELRATFSGDADAIRYLKRKKIF